MEIEETNWFCERISKCFAFKGNDIRPLNGEKKEERVIKCPKNRRILTDEERLIKNHLHSLKYYFNHKEKCLKRRREWGERQKLKQRLNEVL